MTRYQVNLLARRLSFVAFCIAGPMEGDESGNRPLFCSLSYAALVANDGAGQEPAQDERGPTDSAIDSGFTFKVGQKPMAATASFTFYVDLAQLKCFPTTAHLADHSPACTFPGSSVRSVILII